LRLQDQQRLRFKVVLTCSWTNTGFQLWTTTGFQLESKNIPREGNLWREEMVNIIKIGILFKISMEVM